MSTFTQTNVVKSPDKDQRILEVATKVFAEQGFYGAETQQIADLADVGKGTVYRYYRSKEELFLAVADAGMRKLEAHIHAAIDSVDDAIDLIQTAGRAYAEFFQRHPELVEILIQERAAFRSTIPATHLVYRQKNRRIFEDTLRRAIKDGVLRDVNVREATRAFANVLYGTVVCGCLEGSTRKLRKMADHVIDIFLNGILVDPSDE